MYYQKTEYKTISWLPEYRIGSDGSIWSYKGLKPKLLSQQKTKNGYIQVGLRVNNKNKKFYVHVLVAAAFLGPKQPDHNVRHLDGSRTNNFVSNLAYGTQKENMADAIAHGTTPRGEKNGQSKLSKEDVERIMYLSSRGFSSDRIATLYPVGRRHISKILKKERWAWV